MMHNATYENTRQGDEKERLPAFTNETPQPKDKQHGIQEDDGFPSDTTHLSDKEKSTPEDGDHSSLPLPAANEHIAKVVWNKHSSNIKPINDNPNGISNDITSSSNSAEKNIAKVSCKTHSPGRPCSNKNQPCTHYHYHLCNLHQTDQYNKIIADVINKVSTSDSHQVQNNDFDDVPESTQILPALALALPALASAALPYAKSAIKTGVQSINNNPRNQHKRHPHPGRRHPGKRSVNKQPGPEVKKKDESIKNPVDPLNPVNPLKPQNIVKPVIPVIPVGPQNTPNPLNAKNIVKPVNSGNTQDPVYPVTPHSEDSETEFLKDLLSQKTYPGNIQPQPQLYSGNNPPPNIQTQPQMQTGHLPSPNIMHHDSYNTAIPSAKIIANTVIDEIGRIKYLASVFGGYNFKEENKSNQEDDSFLNLLTCILNSLKYFADESNYPRCGFNMPAYKEPELCPCTSQELFGHLQNCSGQCCCPQPPYNFMFLSPYDTQPPICPVFTVPEFMGHQPNYYVQCHRAQHGPENLELLQNPYIGRFEYSFPADLFYPSYISDYNF